MKKVNGREDLLASLIVNGRRKYIQSGYVRINEDFEDVIVLKKGHSIEELREFFLELQNLEYSNTDENVKGCIKLTGNYKLVRSQKDDGTFFWKAIK